LVAVLPPEFVTVNVCAELAIFNLWFPKLLLAGANPRLLALLLVLVVAEVLVRGGKLDLLLLESFFVHPVETKIATRAIEQTHLFVRADDMKLKSFLFPTPLF
jgi:hypothetical protein